MTEFPKQHCAAGDILDLCGKEQMKLSCITWTNFSLCSMLVLMLKQMRWWGSVASIFSLMCHAQL